MTLKECIEKHTYREFLMWQEWLDSELSQPDKNSYYLMQIAAEVRHVLAKKGTKINLDDFRLKFSDPEQPSASSTKTAAKLAKAKWKAMTGITKPKQDN